MSFNKVIIIGNIGKDCELRYTSNGTPICNFNIATNERRKDKTGEMQDITTWFRVALYGKFAESSAPNLLKGKSIYVEGRLNVKEWTDRDGKIHHTLEINASDMKFIGGGDEQSKLNLDSKQQSRPTTQPPAARPSSQPSRSRRPVLEEDVPF